VAVCNTDAVVFANGDCSTRVLQRAGIKRDTFVVCVDGGLRHANAHGVQPHLLVGDFDSAQAEQLGAVEYANTPRITHPADKDASDLELALLELEQRQFKRVTLLGVSGGRTDHSLFNWMLPAVKPWAFKVRLIDETSDAHVISADKPFATSLPIGTLLSLVALLDTTGVSTSGLQYSLKEASIMPGSTLGLSNVVAVDDVSVVISSGVMLALINY